MNENYCNTNSAMWSILYCLHILLTLNYGMDLFGLENVICSLWVIVVTQEVHFRYICPVLLPMHHKCYLR